MIEHTSNSGRTRLVTFIAPAWVVATLAVLVLVSPVLDQAEAQVAQQSVMRYFEDPCRDDNEDGVDDFFELPINEPWVDVMVVFDEGTFDPDMAGPMATTQINQHQPSAVLQYVSTYSPYVFVGGIVLGNTPATTPIIQGLLGMPGVIGIRSYERFVLPTDQTVDTVPGATHYRPEQDTGGEPDTPGLAPPLGSPAGGLVPSAYENLPMPPEIVVYFVDSGINGEAYWGIDVTVDDPLAPELASDPDDISAIRHGTFLATLARQTVHAALFPGGRPVLFADVKVAVAPGGETTTLELTRAFDAITAHILYEQSQGRNFRAVVNCSYDTDGGIANHDIIYPSPGVGPSPLATGVVATPRIASDTRVASVPVPGDPCSVTLFDTVYGSLSSAFGAVICVGAGNDGEVASYVINEVGKSANTTIVVSALDPRTMQPAGYSNFGKAPGGINGHPDVAAVGRIGAPGFDYLLEGTSVSTALVTAMAAAALSQDITRSPLDVLEALVDDGEPMTPVGDKRYGDARVILPWDPDPDGGVQIPPGSVLLRVTPNPIRERAVLHFDLEATVPVRVQLFDLSGRLVRTIHDGPLATGPREVLFDGLAGDGRPLSSGIYFARVQEPSGQRVVRLLLRR